MAPEYIRTLQDVRDKDLPHELTPLLQPNLMRFPARFIQEFLGGEEYSPGLYTRATYHRRFPITSRQTNKIMRNRSYYICDLDKDPYCPHRVAQHGAKLCVFFRDLHSDDQVMNVPLFVCVNAARDLQEFGERRYMYLGQYSQTRFSDRIDHERLQTEISLQIKTYWAELLADSMRPQWLTERLRQHLWWKPSYEGGIPEDIACIDAEVQIDLLKHINDVRLWKEETDGFLKTLTTEKLLAQFDKADSDLEPGLRFWWEYLECIGFNRNFYYHMASNYRESDTLRQVEVMCTRPTVGSQIQSLAYADTSADMRTKQDCLRGEKEEEEEEEEEVKAVELEDRVMEGDEDGGYTHVVSVGGHTYQVHIPERLNLLEDAPSSERRVDEAQSNTRKPTVPEFEVKGWRQVISRRRRVWGLGRVYVYKRLVTRSIANVKAAVLAMTQITEPRRVKLYVDKHGTEAEAIETDRDTVWIFPQTQSSDWKCLTQDRVCGERWQGEDGSVNQDTSAAAVTGIEAVIRTIRAQRAASQGNIVGNHVELERMIYACSGSFGLETDMPSGSQAGVGTSAAVSSTGSKSSDTANQSQVRGGEWPDPETACRSKTPKLMEFREGG